MVLLALTTGIGPGWVGRLASYCRHTSQSSYTVQLEEHGNPQTRTWAARSRETTRAGTRGRIKPKGEEYVVQDVAPPGCFVRGHPVARGHSERLEVHRLAIRARPRRVADTLSSDQVAVKRARRPRWYRWRWRWRRCWRGRRGMRRRWRRGRGWWGMRRRGRTRFRPRERTAPRSEPLPRVLAPLGAVGNRAAGAAGAGTADGMPRPRPAREERAVVGAACGAALGNGPGRPEVGPCAVGEAPPKRPAGVAAALQRGRGHHGRRRQQAKRRRHAHCHLCVAEAAELAAGRGDVEGAHLIVDGYRC